MIADANAGGGWVGSKGQAAEDMEEEDGGFEAETTATATGGGLVVQVGQEFGVKSLRVDGVGMGGVVMQAEVLVGDPGDLAAVQSLQEVRISRMRQGQWEGDVVQVVLDLGGRKGRWERGVVVHC